MRPENCLLIDDDTDDQDIFGMCLKKVSPEIKFRAVNDCVEALNILESEKEYTPDFIFLDVNLPRMNGIECLQALTKIQRLKDTKIYMYSTTSEKASVEKSMRLGATDFIIKPAKTDDLKQKLASIFSIVTRINTLNIQ